MLGSLLDKDKKNRQLAPEGREDPVSVFGLKVVCQERNKMFGFRKGDSYFCWI